MPSIIEGYNYDIFISYRQKDNKGDRWVSHFVDALKTELESTFKDEISVYFDINLHDGILETHDVGASLKDKLKCLVFIPIISRTYCDPKSFAWEHEFKAFVEQAAIDKFGMKINLPGGNVAGRVLPVRIHDLDIRDIQEYESVLGSYIRGVEFIYREPGVNRPLTIKDNEDKNLNHTIYRNQINKVALAVKEIVSGLKGEPMDDAGAPEEFIPTIGKLPIQEKSIIVLPFENISPDPDQEYFSDGLTEEIITDLSHIHDLLVISRSSAMTFKGTNKKIGEIAKEVNVRYVLEGSVRKAGNNLRITAQLIDGISDSHIWAEKYSGTLDDIFDIQEKVSQNIAHALKIQISSWERKKIQERPIDNAFAYDCYKRAYPEINSMSKERLDNGLKLLYKGLDITGENAVLYSGVAFAYMMYANIGIDQEDNITKAEEFLQKAIDLDKELAEAHFTLGGIRILKDGNMIKAIDHWAKAHASKPEDPEIMVYLSLGYDIVGQDHIARSLVEKCAKIDPINPLNEAITGWNHFFGGRFELALDALSAAYNLSPENPMHQYFKALSLVYNDKADEAYDFICQNVEEPSDNIWSQVTIFLKYIIKRDKDKLNSLLTSDFVQKIQRDLQYSYHIATFYAYLDDKKESYKWLENAINRGFINYPLLNKQDKLLVNLRGEARFKKLMERVKHEWENFEI